ncbi:dTMP kinase [Actinacidiphila acidipaludis]|uniref:Thymidylate kinase n=1 Tax=Actinacidiphila acidipaludis TaxID=2873382 RepID=A0ABS7QE12_9ACTN|nr:dTMP kinase [Streptomyces acidipaludis]MBY8881409.1 dTMP kinase [Streptomyces acidipaludis]
MTRSEQPAHPADAPDTFATDLAADSRERAVGALLKIPALRRLWSAQITGAVADRLGMLVLLLLTVQAVASSHAFQGGYRGAAFAASAVFAARMVATLLFGAVLLGPLSALTAEGGPLDRRWTMIGADAVRLALFIIAPLWITWVPDSAHIWLLVTAFVTGAADRLWAVAKDGAAPVLLPPSGDTSVRPGPDRLATLHRLDLRTSFVALPLAAAVLVVVTMINTLIALGADWFHLHQVALSSYVAAGLFSSSIAILYLLELPSGTTARPRSPLEGLRLPKGPAGAERGRTGTLPLLVLATSAVAGAIGAAVALAVLRAGGLGFGPVGFGLLVLALTAGTVIGIRVAPRTLPALSRRRLLALAIGVTGIALLLTGIVADQTTVLLLALLAGVSAGLSANTGHVLVEQEAEEPRRARTVEHLQAVARAVVAVGAIVAPLVAAAIGPHRIHHGHFTFDHEGAAYTLILVGALLLPVAALVLGKTDDRTGVPLRRDLREALRGAEPAAAPADTGFFIALEGGDGAGKSTQVEALAEWIRAKGHEVVVTREPGATAVGKRLRSILLDVSAAGISHRAEALLYAADRAEHVDTVVRPALARGAVVISDRYIDSSVAYQGAGRDLAPTEIARISRWATDGLVPHLTVLLDVSPETARERFTEAPDRLESEPAEFHQRVRAGFLTLAAADPARYLVVDAGQAPEDVTTVVRHRLDQLLPLSEKEIEARAEAERKAAEEAARRAAEEAARKAEEERLERERQAQLEKLRREEEERRLAAEEAARREIAERKAAQEAEAARLRAEEEARVEAEAAAKRAAEEAAHAAEQERLRRLADEQARLRAEADERRAEKQRKAEEALLRAEAARAAAAAAAEHAAAEESDTAETQVLPQVPSEGAAAAESADAVEDAGDAGGSDQGGRDSGGGSDDGGAGGSGDSGHSGDSAGGRGIEDTTVLTPVSRQAERADEAAGSSENTTVMTPVPAAEPRAQAEEGADADAGLRSEPDPSETTTVLPPVVSRDDDETAMLPPVPGTARDADPADRVPPWMFRPETSDNERTRELPSVQSGSAGGERSGGTAEPGRRPRPAWAEETPLDDLPSLADELLGRNDEGEPPARGSRK